MKKKIILLTVIGLFICSSAFAFQIFPTNTRPVTVNPSPDASPGAPFAGPNLQNILDYMFGTNVISATNDQQIAGMWGGATNPPSIGPTLVVEVAGNATINMFGIWSGTDSTSIVAYDIFSGAALGFNAGGPTAAIITWNLAGLMTVSGPAPGVISQSNVTGINPSSFGFYLSNPQGGLLFYTIDQLNTNGEAHALAYRAPGTNDWAIAFEDLPFFHLGGSAWSDRDYNDMVVKVESLAPAVPEPATMLLLGSGLIGLAGFARRRFKK